MIKYKRTSAIENQLSALSKKIQVKYFTDLKPLSVLVNPRLSSIYARIFIPGIFHNPRIEINPKFYHRSTLSQIKSTLKHEYIHYWLNEKRLPYNHNMYFLAKAKALNCSANGCVREVKQRGRLSKARKTIESK